MFYVCYCIAWNSTLNSFCIVSLIQWYHHCWSSVSNFYSAVFENLYLPHDVFRVPTFSSLNGCHRQHKNDLAQTQDIDPLFLFLFRFWFLLISWPIWSFWNVNWTNKAKYMTFENIYCFSHFYVKIEIYRISIENQNCFVI